MCDPATAMAVMMAVTAGAQHNASVKSTEAQNRNRQTNQLNANKAAQNKYQQEQRRLIEESRSAQQEGYDAALATASALSTGIVSAAGAGVTGVSVNALLADEVAIGGRNQARIKDKMNNLELGFLTNTKAYQQQAEGIVAANAYSKGPSKADGYLAVALGAAQGYAMGGGFSPTPSPGTGTASTAATANANAYAGGANTFGSAAQQNTFAIQGEFGGLTPQGYGGP